MKKVTYKIEQFKSITVEVETEEQAQQIEELNRDFERTDRQDRRIKAKTDSLDQMYEETGYEPVDDGESPEEHYIERERNAELKKKIAKAMEELTEKQKIVVYKTFWEEKTLREISRELNVHHSSIEEIYMAAIKKLKKFLTNF